MIYNIDLEKSVLATLLDGKNFDKVEGVITGKDFYAGRHQIIFQTISQLYDQKLPHDTHMVLDRLTAENNLQAVGGENYLGELLGVFGSVFNLLAHAQRLKELSQRRNAVEVMRAGVERLENLNDDTAGLLNDSISKLNSVMLQSNKHSHVTVGDLTEGFYKKLMDVAKNWAKPFIGTGFVELDNKMQIEKGDLVIIAARPSMGKTTLAQNIARHMVAETGKAGVFFSLEMTKESVVQRLVSDIGSVRLGAIRSGDLSVEYDARFDSTTEWGRMMTAVKEIDSLNYVIDDTNEITIGQMRSVLNKIRHEKGGIGMIMIDYIQIMGGVDDNNVVRGISNITRALKGFGKEFDCPVIALSQLNRSLEGRTNKRPIMSDLRESGAIEQDADQIIFIYRDEVYNEKTEHKGVAEIIVGKNRQGEIGTVRLGFEGKYSRFTNLMPDYDQNPFLEASQ